MADLPTAKLRFGTTSGVLIGAVDENGFIDGALDPTRLTAVTTIGGTNLVIVGVGSLMKSITLTNLVTVLKAAGIAASTHTHAGVYEPVITAGTSLQVFLGDKSLATINQALIAGLKVTDSPTFAGLTLDSINAALSVYSDAALKFMISSKSSPGYYFTLDHNGNENVNGNASKILQFGGVTKYTFGGTGVLDCLGHTINGSAFVDASRNVTAATVTATTATIGT